MRALAVALFGRVPAKVGPFETTMAIRPSLNGHTVVHLAPLGTIDLDTHDWPVALDLRVDEIAVADAERIADEPLASSTAWATTRPTRCGRALVGLAVRALHRRSCSAAWPARWSPGWRGGPRLGGAAVGALLVAALGLGSWATFRGDAVAEPRYTGLLTRAPAAVGDIDGVLDRFGEYREQLGDLVDNMATLYLAGAELPVFETDSRLIRVLHVSDIHLNPQAFDLMERLIEQFGVDAVADTGDLTDWGTDPEAQLVARIGRLGVPYVFVRGNHDSHNTQEAVAAQPNAVVLDGDGGDRGGAPLLGHRRPPLHARQEPAGRRYRAGAGLGLRPRRGRGTGRRRAAPGRRRPRPRPADGRGPGRAGAARAGRARPRARRGRHRAARPRG